jgi:hypothetical protein
MDNPWSAWWLLVAFVIFGLVLMFAYIAPFVSVLILGFLIYCAVSSGGAYNGKPRR